MFKRIAVAASLTVLSMGAQATDLGYGDLIGTWKQGGPGGYDNPSSSNASTIGQYILDVLNPDPFALSDFHPAGDTGGSWTSALTLNTTPGTGFHFTYLNSGSGNWNYTGLPANDPLINPEGYPANTPVDLYLTVKYGSNFSVFFFDDVHVGDTGHFTNDYHVYNASFDPGNPPGGADATQCASNYTFGANCMAWGNNSAPGISHLVSYWPADGELTTLDLAETPEPATLALLTAGLLGLGVLRRRRA